MTKHKNTIDLTRYVAIGDSITAGYTDGGLCFYGQQNSYVNLMAKQFKLMGGGEFTQPLIDENSVGIGFTGNSCLVLKNISESLEPSSVVLSYRAEKGDHLAFEPSSCKTPGPYNNMGVPGLKMISVSVPEFGNPYNGDGFYNPYFTRMAMNPKVSSILSDILALNPSFFSLFLGNNDALMYALSGGTADAITPLSGPPNVGFQESLDLIVKSLIKNGARGVIANLPDIHTVPYFSSIPYNGLIINSQDVSKFNKMYLTVGIRFHEGRNAFIINDPELKGIRQIEKRELILADILLDDKKQAYLNGHIPIPKKYVLSKKELLSVQNAISSYNTSLKSIAEASGLAFVDVNTLLKTARPDRIYNGLEAKLIFKKGGVFSLDGLHPNAFGQALLANEFIREINNRYNENIPMIDINTYKGVEFP